MNTVATKINKYGRNIDCNSDLVICTGYFPELNVSPAFNCDQENYYKNYGMKLIQTNLIGWNFNINLIYLRIIGIKENYPDSVCASCTIYHSV